jgi:Tfp pilus assembly protein PilF
MRAVNQFTLVFCFVALSCSCGTTEISEKAERQSDRFYDAAYISWHDEQDNLTAIRNLTRAISSNPYNDRAHYLLGAIRLARGELQEAEIHLKEAAKLRATGNPSGLTEVQNTLGVLFIHTKRYAEATEILEKAVGEVLNREPWLAYGNLGWAYIESGKYDKAIEVLKRAMFEQPKFCVGAYRLGQAFYLKQDYSTASTILKQAVEIPEPGCDQMQDAHHFLGMAYLRLGRDGEAKQAFERCCSVSATTETGIACAAALEGL